MDTIPDGLREAINIAVEIARENIKDIYVTHSPDGEYTSSYDVIAVKIKQE
jgi:hypothetical protein